MKIGAKVDLNISNLMINLFEFLVISFHDFTPLKSKSIANLHQVAVLDSAIFGNSVIKPLCRLQFLHYH